jgi:hypothetical protein
MTSEEYGQYIDDFELGADVMPGESLTEYIERRRREFESKADGGAIGIEVLFGPKRDEYQTGGRIGFDNGGQTAPSGVFSLQQYVNFLNAVDDYNNLLGKGEKLAGEAGDFLKLIGDKEYEDLTEKELSKEKELEDKVEDLEDKVLKTEEDYERKTRDLPEDEETMGAYARKLIDDVNERDERFETLADLMGLKKGGRVGFKGGGADASKSDYKSPGSKSYSRSYNPGAGGVVQHSFNVGGGGGGDGPKGPDGPPSVINPPPQEDKSTELFTFDEYTGKPMTYADVAVANKFLNFVKTKGNYTKGENPEADALYDAFRTATGRDTFMQDATVDSVTNMKTTETDGNLKQFMDKTSTITDNPTGKMTKSLVVDTPTSFTQRFITPTGIMENDVPQKFGAPQSLVFDPPKNIIGSELKDGGRVGLFMGGPALEGQALNIYNSMKGYNFSDQEIADALSARGLYTPAGSGTTQPEQVTGIIGSQVNQGDDRVIGLQETFTKDLSGDPRFSYLTPQEQANKYRFDRSVEPREGLMGFFDTVGNKFKESRFFQPKIRGTLGTRLANQPRLPLPGAIASYSMSPFNPDSKNYNPDFIDQLNFLELGDDMIGMSGTGLKYGSGSVLAGQNVISGFGSNNYLTQLNKFIAKTKNDKRRQQGIDERNAFLAAQEEKQKAQLAAQLAIAQKEIAAKGYQDYGSGAASEATQKSYEGPDGSYAGASTEDYGGGEKDGGIIGYRKGGLATMFTRRR